MSNLQKEKLIQLIYSMTTSEKRSFRLYLNSLSGSADKLFVQLFDYLDREQIYDGAEILKNIPKIKKTQLSNLKANLFNHILNSLRLIKRKQVDEIKVREQIDFARILYDKGMYKQCLEILEKAKKLSQKINYETLTLSILYFQKRIETQHVTGSMAPTARELSLQSKELLENLELTNKLSNASLLLYGEYLKYGYVRNEKDFHQIKDFFEQHLPQVELSKLNFYQSLYYFQSYVWYSNMTHNFIQCYRYAQRWVELFRKNPNSKFSETPQYLKGLHNLLNSLFMVQFPDRFNEVFNELESFKLFDKPFVTKNDISLWILIRNIHKLNQVFLTGEFKEGTKGLLELEELLEDNRYNWDRNRHLVFNYKIACVYFGAGEYEKAIDFLGKITFSYIKGFREDIQCFARILSLVSHFELGNIDLVNYQVRSVMRFLLKSQNMEKVQEEILKFLRKTPRMQEKGMKKEFALLKEKLLVIKQQKFEQRPFLYFDIISWLESKIDNLPIETVIQKNLLLQLKDNKS